MAVRLEPIKANTYRMFKVFSPFGMGVLAELCQRGLVEAMGLNAFFKDNTELINQLLPVIGRRLPLGV